MDVNLLHLCVICFKMWFFKLNLIILLNGTLLLVKTYMKDNKTVFFLNTILKFYWIWNNKTTPYNARRDIIVFFYFI